MTNVSRLIFLFCLVFSPAFGQAQNLILTREQNDKWFDNVKPLKFYQQLLTIKDRLLSDTNVFVRHFYADGIKVVDQPGNRVYGDGKPLIIIGGYPMIIDNETGTKKIIGLAQLLDTIHVKTIFVFSGNDPAMSAIYGTSAQSGILVMALKRKKYLKKFRQLKLEPNY